ncbi:MAG: energy transducer TonB [Bacteroidales bacterium]
MEEEKQNEYMSAGLIGTLLFHGIIVVLLLIFGFTTPLPLPEEQGVVVNLGYSGHGMGDIQPREPAEQIASSSSSAADESEEVATQNTEDAPELSSSSGEQQTQETGENREAAPDESQVDENLTYPGRRTSEGGSEGQTGEPGDQGAPGGDPGADNYQGSPGGEGGNVDYSLSGRYSRELPEPPKDFREQGKVVVKIWVNREGNVIKAEPGQKGSTTGDSQLYRMAKKAAMNARFNKKNDAPEVQTGTITYTFTHSR